MTRSFIELHRRPPSAVAFMARALVPSPGLAAGGAVPPLVQRWEGLRIDANHLAAFRRASGLDDENSISVLYPHVFGFSLQMALLTHRAFPLPIWNALQVRNRLTRHRHILPGERLDLETRIGGQRIVDRGIEIDLHSRLMRESTCCWESEITYFYRGRFGNPSLESPAEAPKLSAMPVVDRFRMPGGGGWHYGTLTGDYNGIHWAAWYARLLGFRSAFPHPQRVAGMCMARLRGPESEAQTLDLWIKGPVFYGAGVNLSAATSASGVLFGLSLDGDSRIALLGQWQAAGGDQ
jgi:hypothetical protein